MNAATTSAHAGAHDDTIERLRVALAGRYTVERLLGEGGMGRVYLGLDDALQRKVAIKVIRGDHVSSAAARERFLREARVVAALRHPAIVTVFAAGEHDGLLWFAMEYVEGESLRELITRDGRQSAERVHAMVAELAGALDAAHRSGVVHRDVKPENVLVERDTGRVRLADFGVARALEASAASGVHQTGTGFILGSPRYMSPEQVSGDASIDGRSDLYALALVAYELLTGTPVIQATHPAAMLVEQLTAEVPPVRTAAPATPPPLADAIDGALAKKADARWPDARTMLDVLGVDSDASLGGVRITGSMRVRAMQRKRVGRWLVAGAAVLVALAAGLLTWSLRSGTNARGLVVVPFDVPAGQPDQAWLREGAVNMLTLNLAQWRDVDVVDYERTLDLLRDANAADGRVTLSQATTVARKVDAASFIMGQITPGGDSLLVVARRYDRDGTLKRTVQVAMARTADPRAAFDQLAVRLLDVPATTSLIALTAATTTSLEAYRVYLDGLRALNSWKLERADSLFSRAIALDTTFALAWYKRGITRGWNGFGDTTPSSAEIALRYAARLPERERHQVAGHRWLWSALDEVMADSVRLRSFEGAIREYRAGVARDGASAEAWYGLADALWHLAQFRQDSSAFGPLLLEARDGFERALTVDPDMHLAYSHLVDLHRQLGTPASRWIMVRGAIVPDSTVADTTARKAARRASDEQMLVMAERWATADPDSPRSWQAVAEALGRIGRADSAARLMRAVDVRLAATPHALALRAAYFDFLGGSPLMAANLRAALGDGSLPWWGTARATGPAIVALAINTAAAAGDGALIDDLFAAWARVDERDARDPRTVQMGAFYNPPMATRHALRTMLTPWWRTILRATMGAPLTPAVRDSLRRGSLAAGKQFRATPYDRAWALGAAYAAFMLTGDTTHVDAMRILDRAGSYPEIDAALQLARGDTAAARVTRRTFASVERVRSSNLGLAGLRTQQRVLVLLALGDTVEALAQHEAIEPLRFNINFLEPGLAWYVRSLALRATLAERLGHREKAIAAWRELLQRWSVEDPDTRARRDEARAALVRLSATSAAR